ncbi:MAG TPA: hypothetical protein VN033_14400 [Vulgatibacter sp.]|nr:hypothetical protein [Vulgatibacter sp.]
MTWLKRHGASLALAAVLALIGGAAVGCGDGEGGGEGGSGGTAGAGGEGGTGGTGGEPLCGTKACGDGEKCNRRTNPPRCECTTQPEDSCTAVDPDTICGPSKTCVPKPPEPDDFVYCDGFEEEFSDDGKFFCMPLTSGRAIWVRLCMDANDQCVRSDTVCLRESEDTPICWFNLCDETNTDTGEPDGNKRNGSAFGPCDTWTGVISASRTPTGTCLPEEDSSGTVYICNDSGDAVPGDACRFNAPRGDAELCTQGSQCITFNLPTPSCTTDADCDPTQSCTDGVCGDRECSTDSDCGPDGFCVNQPNLPQICIPKGECYETCNAGTADITEDFATCTSVENGCFGLGGSVGYCNGPLCDLIDGGCDGDKICQFAGAAKGNPRAGICEEGTLNTGALGDPCGSATGVDCQEGLICVGSQNNFFCRQLCECEGDGGWATNDVCLTSTSQCAAGEVCTNVGISNFLGACFPEPQQQ